MKISLNWLNDYIDLSQHSLESITQTLTDLGLEVEGVENVEPWKGEVLVGQITNAIRHPNADTLQVCEVDVGKEEKLSIVCGAPNARAGLKVAVATIGCVLPGDFKIKAGKIRGEKSFGMLCSEAELGLSKADEGIAELDEKLAIGSDLADVMQLKDTAIELSITPNRADCLGMIGIARDLSAKLALPLKLAPRNPELHEASLKTAAKIEVTVSNFEDCARFVALYVEGLEVKESPLWLKRRLEASGMRSINQIVDVTNYVMLEYSQPIHAYDMRDLSGGVIGVRRAKDKESLTTLDGQKRSLTADDIVITDASKAVGLAGVMGGENSEVKDDTKAILIEVAHFNPSLIRKSAKRYAIHSEASHRFERGIDATRLEEVAFRVAELLKEITGENVKIASESIDIGTAAPSLSRIALRIERVRQLTGLSLISLEECKNYLESLGCKHLDHNQERLLVEIPSWRQDLIRETDLIEEIARLHGYDKIQPKLPLMEIASIAENSLIEFSDQLKQSTAMLGLNEIISFPFIGQSDIDNFLIAKDHPFAQLVELANPLVEEQKYLRTSMAQSLLKALCQNRRHGIHGSKLFELARNFYEFDGYEFKHKELEHLANFGAHLQGRGRDENRPIERNMLGGILDQPFAQASWNSPEVTTSFFHAKSIVSTLLEAFGALSLRLEPMKEGLVPWLHPSASASLYIQDQWAGYIGELHPKVATSFDLDFEKPPILFEVDVDAVWQDSLKFKSYSSLVMRFPPVERDIALVLSQNHTNADVVAAMSRFNRKKFLKNWELFDIYESEKLAAGTKSLAYRLSFQSESKTLTDKEVDKELGALLEHLKSEIGAQLR